MKKTALLDFLRDTYAPSRITIGKATVYQIELTIRALQRWRRRRVFVEDLTEELLRDFLGEFSKDHSPASTNTARHRLLALWRSAWQQGLLPAQPRTSLVHRVRECPPPPEAWTAAEVARILFAVKWLRGTIAGIPKPDWWRSLILAAFDSGERRGALLAVSPADVSLRTGRIRFHKTKTGRVRTCCLHADTVVAIGNIYNAARPLLWPWPFSLVNLSGRFRAILKRARVPYGRGHGGLFHKLRRTSGTLVEANGGDGAKHLGNSRVVFERSYLDRRFIPDQLALLPRPQYATDRGQLGFLHRSAQKGVRP